MPLQELLLRYQWGFHYYFFITKLNKNKIANFIAG
jgi:hypothetical protein